MISDSTIKTLASKHQTTQLNILREYFQHLFLSYFYRQPKSDKIYFKGGTALRILYMSPRFSEDLDFSTSQKNIQLIEQIILDTILEVEREAVLCELKEAKVTSGGYLSIINFESGEFPVSVQLEISLREKGANGEVATIVNDFVPAYTLIHLSKKQLVGQKLSALFGRKKPRDFYDLYFLLRANLMTPNERGLLKKVPALLKSCDIAFDRELKQFLPKSHWPIIRNFSETLSREVQRFL